MSEPLQFGYHPDADQISAFIEQALPAHERERMLDHLAACPECRDVVALSLPEIEEPTQPVPAAVRKPWWSAWGLAWPVVGALAAAVLLVVYFRRTATVPNVPDQQVAVAHSAAPPVPLEPLSVPQAMQAPQGSQARRSERQTSSTGLLAIAPKSNHEEATTAQAIGGPMLKGRDVGALRQQAAPPPNLAAEKQMPATRFSAAPSRGLGGVVAGSVAKAPTTAAENRTQEMAPTQAAAMANQPVQKPITSAPMPAATETAAVNNEAPIQTTSADAANIEIAPDEAQQSQLKHPLPSHLAVLSIATQDRQMVAIDTNHSVFVSKDAGKHWKAIQVPWQGRAVKASLVEYRTGARRPLSFSGGAIVSHASNTVSAQAPSPSAAKASSVSIDTRISGAVTDMTGAAIAGASVIVTETATGTAHFVTTDGAGHYVVDGLAPGTYRVEAQSAGFNKQKLDNVAVAASSRSIANLHLVVGAASQTVSVQAANDALVTEEKTLTKSQKSDQPASVFEIITDNGDRWTSSDGVTWKHM